MASHSLLMVSKCSVPNGELISSDWLLMWGQFDPLSSKATFCGSTNTVTTGAQTLQSGRRGADRPGSELCGTRQGQA